MRSCLEHWAAQHIKLWCKNSWRKKSCYCRPMYVNPLLHSISSLSPPPIDFPATPAATASIYAPIRDIASPRRNAPIWFSMQREGPEIPSRVYLGGSAPADTGGPPGWRSQSWGPTAAAIVRPCRPRPWQQRWIQSRFKINNTNGGGVGGGGDCLSSAWRRSQWVGELAAANAVDGVVEVEPCVETGGVGVFFRHARRIPRPSPSPPTSTFIDIMLFKILTGLLSLENRKVSFIQLHYYLSEKSL